MSFGQAALHQSSLLKGLMFLQQLNLTEALVTAF